MNQNATFNLLYDDCLYIKEHGIFWVKQIEKMQANYSVSSKINLWMCFVCFNTVHLIISAVFPNITGSYVT